MKINKAHTNLEERLSKSDQKSERKTYKQLLGALTDLKERDMSDEELQSVETAIDRLRLHDTTRMSARELRSRSNRFIKDVHTTLSLIPENHYMALGMAFGVAFGAVISSVLQGFSDMSQSGTGLGIGIGLIAGYLLGSYLDIEASKQNRVLKTRTT